MNSRYLIAYKTGAFETVDTLSLDDVRGVYYGYFNVIDMHEGKILCVADLAEYGWLDIPLAEQEAA